MNRTFKLKYSVISLTCFFIIVFILTRHIPFRNYSILGNIALLILLFINFPKNKSFYIFTFINFLLIGYSLIIENNINFIIRFSIVLFSICACYYITLNKTALRILFYLSFIQCLFIISFEIFMLSLPDNNSYSAIRHLFLDNGWGDIYKFSQNGLFYKIQVLGNAIIPYVYMLSYLHSIFPLKYKLIFRIIFFIASILSGQFAFIIAIGIFHIFFFFKNVKNNKQLIYTSFLFLLLSSLSFIPIYNYINNTLERKKDVSNAIRIEQKNLLMEDLSDNVTTLFLGKGLGNTLTKQTKFRDYTDNIYFELQTIYILNQLGILFFTLYILYNVYLAVIFIKYKDLLIVYFCYVIYAVTNPYIFDTNQIVVILTLTTISNIRSRQKLSSFSKENYDC